MRSLLTMLILLMLAHICVEAKGEGVPAQVSAAVPAKAGDTPVAADDGGDGAAKTDGGAAKTDGGAAKTDDGSSAKTDDGSAKSDGAKLMDAVTDDEDDGSAKSDGAKLTDAATDDKAKLTDTATDSDTKTEEEKKKEAEKTEEEKKKEAEKKKEEEKRAAEKKEEEEKAEEQEKKKGEWGYPAKNSVWGGECEGKAQSPVDLPTMTAANEQYALTDYMQYRKVTIRGEDCGTGLKWKAKEGQPSMGYITVDSVKYNLESVQIHTGSEHTVNGKQYDMEVQLNHKSEGGQSAVVALVCSVMPLTDVSPFFTKLQVAMSADTEIDPISVFDGLETRKYFQYSGSLTQPPCTEGATWIIVANVCSIPQDFYKYVKGLDSMKDNYRPPQNLNKRTITTKASNLNDHWHYPARNQEWGGDCKAGNMQSPIDLPLTVLSSITARSSLLDKMKYESVGFKGSDSGHGLKWISDKEMGYLELHGKTYKLLSINVHSKSEHTIAGRQFDLEIQFMHRSADEKNAIVSLLCESENFGENEFFNKLEGGTQAAVKIDLKKDFLSNLDTTRYFTYPGSLTTPPCTEGVEWVILAANVKVPKDFMIFLKKYKTMKDNFRPTQPIGERSVETVELEEAAGDIGEEDQHIDLADLSYPTKIGIAMGTFGVCGLFLLLCRCHKKDPYSVSLLHENEEV